MKVVPLRLQPGDDVRRALDAWMAEQEAQAGCVISAVASLAVAHLPIAIAGSSGAVIGGHLCGGSLVRTTAELVLGLLPEWEFGRKLDPATGCAELQISRQPPAPLASAAAPPAETPARPRQR
jgi:predicted DNA-binding protein with PD1-like motif